MSLYKSKYDGFKIGLIVSDDITDEMLLNLKKANENYLLNKKIAMEKQEKWELIFVKDICIGIGTVAQNADHVTYCKMIFNTVLPDTDEEYLQQKEEIEGTAKLVCDLYNNLSNGKSFV